MNSSPAPIDADYPLTQDESIEVAHLIQRLEAIDQDRISEAVLLGDIPVFDDGGFETIGYLHQDDDRTWRFTRDLTELRFPLPRFRTEVPE